MRFNAKRAFKSALWIFPFSAIAFVTFDFLFGHFEAGDYDWNELIAKAIFFTAILSVLSGREKVL